MTAETAETKWVISQTSGDGVEEIQMNRTDVQNNAESFVICTVIIFRTVLQYPTVDFLVVHVRCGPLKLGCWLVKTCCGADVLSVMVLAPGFSCQCPA